MAETFPDVVIFLPGIMGSVLEKDGRPIWAPSAGAFARGLFSLAGSVQSLALGKDDPAVDDLGDGITATRLFPDVHLFPGLWKIDGYTSAIEYLRKAFNLKPGSNLFEFPYDWRRDNRVAARRLERESHRWLQSWRTQSGNSQAKLILIGHSMGGLIARYFVEALKGWPDTRMLITLGTPHRGSLNALDFIANGLRKGIGPVTLLDLSDFLRSLTSVYQLLPIYPCVDDGTGQYLRVNEVTGVSSLVHERVMHALGFHQEIQHAWELHQKDSVYLRDFVFCPVVGTFQETKQSAIAEGKGLQLLTEHGGKDYEGDGTVPRVSAVPPAEKAQISGISVAQRHGSLQNSRSVLNQIEYLLRGLQIDDKIFRSLRNVAHAGLALEDLYSSTKPLTIKVRCDDPSQDLEVTIQSIDTGSSTPARTVRLAGEEWTKVELPPFSAGRYRMRVAGAGVEPVQDVFVVMDA
jgi:pimeloyl-ACP methyl ester carboxylesterase